MSYSLRISLSLALLAGGATNTDAAAAQAPATISELHGETSVRAWNGVQAWTDFSAADHKWHVVVRRAGAIFLPAAIPAGDERLKVDVGPGPDGRPALVYVRCAERCYAVVSDLDGRRARIVTASAGASVATIWRSRVAWVRGRNVVLTRLLRAGSASHVPGVPRRKCYERVPGRRRCERPQDGSVDDLELRGGQLALVVSYGLSQGGGNGQTEVRMQSVRGGAQRLLAFMNVGEGGQRWVGPSWAQGKLFFYRSCRDCQTGQGAYRYDPRTGAYSKAPGPGSLAGFAIDDAGRRAFEVPGGYGDRDDSRGLSNALLLTGPLRFGATRSPVGRPGA
jgi:hypothetical protein